MSQQDMSKRDVEMAAKLGKEVDAEQQLKYVEKIKRERDLRVEEIKRERELAEQAKKQALEEETIIPKRTRILQQQMEQEGPNTADTTAPNPDTYDSDKQEYINKAEVFDEYFESDRVDQEEKIVKDLRKVKSRKLSAMAPFEKGIKKEKITELPSYFLSYPEGAEIYVTPYTADDIDELSNSKLSLKYILTRCLEGVYCNFDKNEITFYDAIYLSYYRRILSLGAGENVIDVLSACPYCGKYSNRQVDINKEIEFEDSKLPSLPINVDFSFGTLSFSFLTYGAFMKLETTLESEELAYQCLDELKVEKDSEETSISKLRKLFGQSTGADAALLREVKKLTYHGIKPINTLCQNKECGSTFETLINEWDSIILPFRRSTDDLRSKISFG